MLTSSHVRLLVSKNKGIFYFLNSQIVVINLQNCFRNGICEFKMNLFFQGVHTLIQNGLILIQNDLILILNGLICNQNGNILAQTGSL